MAISLFRRKTIVTVGGRAIESPPLTIEFDLPFDDGSDGNAATVELYNLSQDTLNRINAGDPIVVESGYESDYGVIWLGVVEEMNPQFRGPDRVAVLTIGDGTDRWMTSHISKSWGPGVKASSVARDIVGVLGFELAKLELPDDVTYPDGKAFSTSAKAALEEIAKDTGAKLYVSQGQLVLASPSSTRGTAIVLSPDTGLLAVEKVRNDESEDADDTRVKADWKVVSFLQHRIRTDSLVEVKSALVEGVFRVVGGRHRSSSQEHVTEIEVVTAI